MGSYPRVTRATVVGPNQLRLAFTDGSEGTVDLTPWIAGRTGVFSALHDPAVFAQVTVDPDAGTVVWPNGADLDPDVLHAAVRGDAAGAPGP
ncbi:MAG: DUF2442 domain-containing protein [Gemmatimonadales bacterium]